ncbi:MAG: HAD family hydrolase [Eubacteriales bacterium]|nr:HAD family hydrolase [Eubacteriales bacterium]
MYESFIFDLDGTLWDSCDAVVQAWNQVLRQRGMTRVITREDIAGIMGLTCDAIGKKMFPQMPLEAWHEMFKACNRTEQALLRRRGGRLYEGLEDTLAALNAAGHRLFLVSNCEDGYIDSFYTAHGLECYFADYEYAGRTGHPKGDNIRLIMERNGVTSAAYVGDTQGDCDAAQAAGIPFVYAAYGFGSVDRQDHIIRTPRELLAIK